MSLGVNVLERMDHSFRVEMQVDVKSLVSESKAMASLILEILRTTKLDDEKRLREILDEEYSQMESEMDEAGHAIALQRAMAGFSKAAWAGQYLSGIDYFLFIKELLHHFEAVSYTHLLRRYGRCLRLGYACCGCRIPRGS